MIDSGVSLHSLQQNDDYTRQVEGILNKFGSKGNLPGLDLKTVINNYIEQQFGPYLDQIQKLEEAKAAKDKANEGKSKEQIKKENQEKRKAIVKQYTDQLTVDFRLKISMIKSAYSSIVNNIKLIKENAANASATATIPQTIVAGAATGAPNPAYALLEQKQKKNNLDCMLANVKSDFITLLGAANSIGYQVPPFVLSLADQVATVDSTINAIPV